MDISNINPLGVIPSILLASCMCWGFKLLNLNFNSADNPSIFLKSKSQKVIVKTKGGDLIVDFKHDNNNFYDIYLSGEVEKVFSGIYNYEEN